MHGVYHNNTFPIPPATEGAEQSLPCVCFDTVYRDLSTTVYFSGVLFTISAVMIHFLYVCSLLWTDTRCTSSPSARIPSSPLLGYPLGAVCSCIVQSFRCPGGSIEHTAETHRGHWLWFRSQGHWWHVSDRGWQNPSARIYRYCWVSSVSFCSNKVVVISWFSCHVTCWRSSVNRTDCRRKKTS